MNAIRLTAGERSLLRAARWLYVAQLEARDESARAGGVFPCEVEQDCSTLLLIAVTLLPESLSLEGAAPARAGVLGALSEAEAELRRFPIYDYPPGTSRLVAMLCEALASVRERRP
ncbi:MAG: hypothetical protein QM286_12975 [Acidobacteriota bacterium]|nr:hypothetical protein [Acidobacteriota bacterium]